MHTRVDDQLRRPIRLDVSRRCRRLVVSGHRSCGES